jgi:hypothetical protein
MRPALLLAAALAALAAHPATAQNVTATVTNQELQTLIPGNELTARDLYGRTYTDVFQGRRLFVPQCCHRRGVRLHGGALE